MYADQAKKFLKAKVPLEALGCQGHFHERPEGPAILKRLDKLAVAGLPIWITELDYVHKRGYQRALALQDALTAFFRYVLFLSCFPVF